MRIRKKYKCQVCGARYGTQEAAALCAAQPLAKPRFGVGDVVHLAYGNQTIRYRARYRHTWGYKIITHTKERGPFVPDFTDEDYARLIMRANDIRKEREELITLENRVRHELCRGLKINVTRTWVCLNQNDRQISIELVLANGKEES